ncbi:MAG TPA: hypothetical protein VJ783_03235 [Pirellulales bacterium]|nr:hypothetical protein [Pirellulales bacterium]
MPLHMTRRAGESFSVRSADGARWLRVTLLVAGEEPLLSIEAPSHLRICKDEWPDQGSGVGGQRPGSEAG